MRVDFLKQHREPFSCRMEAPDQLPGRGISPALGKLSLGMGGHSLNGGTWSVTRMMNQSRTGGLSLGLRATLWENGGAWSVTKYLTLGQIMQPRVEAPSQ